MTKLIFYLDDSHYNKLYITDTIAEQDFLNTLYCLYHKTEPTIGVISEKTMKDMRNYKIVNVTDFFSKQYKYPKNAMMTFIRKFIPNFQLEKIYTKLLLKIWDDKYRDYKRNITELGLLNIYLDTALAFTVTMKEEIDKVVITRRN